MSKLTIDDIVSVVVSTAGASTPRDAFNIGCIVGESAHIDVATRCKTYTSIDGMADDGFVETDPEYKAAALYFGQTPAPQKVVIGRKDATQGSTETWLAAVTDCRAKSSLWYGCYLAGTVTDADHQAVATYLNGKTAAYFMDSSDAADLTTANTGKLGKMFLLTFKRVGGIYSTTAYAGAALMGRAMGLNDGTPRSSFTMAYKNLAGVTPDDLDAGQVANLQAKNANYYVNRSGSFNVLEQGRMMDGTWMDELIQLDQLANDMQIACVDVLTKTPTKIPYTDAGVLQLVLACSGACENAVTRGFLAPGVWNLPDVLDLAQGDTLEAGYLCMAEPVAEQSAANKSLRICPPIYACVNMAGAVHNAAVKIIVE